MILYFLTIVEAHHGSALVEAHRGSYCHLMVQVTHTLSSKARSAIDGIETRFRYVDIKEWCLPGITSEGSDFWA